MWVIMPNVVPIGQTVAEISRFSNFFGMATAVQAISTKFGTVTLFDFLARSNRTAAMLKNRKCSINGNY